MTDTERFRALLLEERERVVGAIDYLHRENPGSIEEETGDLASSSIDQHLADMATATFDRELDETLQDNERTLLQRIDAALKRIDEGTYGTCRICGREIPEERLEARPWTDLCIDDARKLERG